jgi:hypothetical protein
MDKEYPPAVESHWASAVKKPNTVTIKNTSPRVVGAMTLVAGIVASDFFGNVKMGLKFVESL